MDDDATAAASAAAAAVETPIEESNNDNSNLLTIYNNNNNNNDSNNILTTTTTSNNNSCNPFIYLLVGTSEHVNILCGHLIQCGFGWLSRAGDMHRDAGDMIGHAGNFLHWANEAIGEPVRVEGRQHQLLLCEDKGLSLIHI